MLKDLNNILERTTIPHKVKLYINKANDVEKLSLEELKDFLDEVSEFENVVLNNKGKIKNEMRMDYVKLITDLRWRLSQLYEDKEMIEDYLENGDFIVVDLDNLSEEKKNYVFSMEVVKNDMEKEINNIKKMYERYNRLYASNKKNKYDYKKFLRKFKIERRTIYYDPSLRIKINYMKKSPFLSKSRLFFVNNFYKVRNLYIDAKFNIEAYLLKVKNNIKSTFNSKKISLIQLKDKLNVKLKLNFIDVKNKLSKINSKLKII